MSPTMTEFPADANGDVLRRMLASGDDLSRAREIEFVHVMPSESAARQMADAATKAGYAAQVHRPDDAADWETTCTVKMLPTHAGITKAEAALAEIAKRLGGHADGWGCFEVR